MTGSQGHEPTGAARPILLWTKRLGVAALASMVLWSGARRLTRASAVDFYHLWGIGAAAEVLDGSPANPYTAPDSVARVLNTLADTSDGDALQRVNAARREVDPTGTPLVYAVFSLLPLDFTTAHTSFTILQYLAFAAGLLLLLRCAALSWTFALLWTFLTMLTFTPFVVDVRVGNINSYQILIVVVVTWLAGRSPASRPFSIILMSGVAFATLWKPNILPVTGAIAVTHLAQVRRSHLLFDIAVGVLSMTILAVGAAAWFGDRGIWLDWFGYVYGGDTGKLASYPVTEGNLATSGLLTRITGVGAPWWTVVLLISLAVTAWQAAQRGARTVRQPLADYAQQVISHPWFVCSLGITVAAAIAPLMWRHYFTWVAAAPAWVLLTRRRLDATAILPGAALLLYWEPSGLITALGASTLDVLQTTAWVLTWLALLDLLRQAALQSRTP